MDNVDLFLEEYRWDPQQYRWRWMTVASSASTHDEKERIFHEPYCGRYRLRIRGTSVTADGEGCGENGIRVYGAVLLEDSARDDADGPDWTVDPENE